MFLAVRRKAGGLPRGAAPCATGASAPPGPRAPSRWKDPPVSEPWAPWAGVSELLGGRSGGGVEPGLGALGASGIALFVFVPFGRPCRVRWDACDRNRVDLKVMGLWLDKLVSWCGLRSWGCLSLWFFFVILWLDSCEQLAEQGELMEQNYVWDGSWFVEMVGWEEVYSLTWPNGWLFKAQEPSPGSVGEINKRKTPHPNPLAWPPFCTGSRSNLYRNRSKNLWGPESPSPLLTEKKLPGLPYSALAVCLKIVSADYTVPTIPWNWNTME